MLIAKLTLIMMAKKMENFLDRVIGTNRYLLGKMDFRIALFCSPNKFR
ncbi:hypothetical protein LEP1GSC202_2618 [Leptospira yanagawae serovar Saopaulo str. Sao Paulo = ATCC 700523]|uniref:Uncharacterized protein n=1 Tax=Leptospira yanagawae serovar Saopaulo str. Sao Paulo = ATCC 700523 TaxID=1249483 RepID=A0A5E8H8R7_9LEPT|nr:hypothetical protein LEP1GSC202_2618 [Leptospira yanagawae serovar Saopaulo str. Sao Paulo = ATCC 700523]